jgi:hypothetical protein
VVVELKVLLISESFYITAGIPIGKGKAAKKATEKKRQKMMHKILVNRK